MVNIQTLKGFRDFLPAEMRKRQYVIASLRKVFESFGFEPLETPALEYEEVLLGKYGDEGDKLMYRFTDNGERRVALRYDQTVPLARVVSQYQNQLPIPFKRYQIQPVWRAENTQKGRFREFLQCDIDTVGLNTAYSDAEILAVVYHSLLSLKFTKFKILINTKPLLFMLMRLSKIPEDKFKVAAIIIDKLDKIGEEAVKQEAITKGVDKTQIDEFFKIANFIQTTYPDSKPFLTEQNTLKGNVVMDALNEHLKPLKEVVRAANNLGIPYEFLVPKFTLARGLDYYTDAIFEVEIEGYEAGSVGGGGRYDNLIGIFAGKEIPAVGFAFGFDRIIEATLQLDLFPKTLTTTQVLVTIFSIELGGESNQIVNKLRHAGVPTELWLDAETKLEKQLKYADSKNIPFVIILGPHEIGSGKVTLKNLRNQTQESLSLDEAISKLTS